MAHYTHSQPADRRRFRHLVEDVSADCRYAARSLSRQPVLASAAILCLAIGIAANATMFDVVDRLLLRPPAGVRDASSLLWIAAERHIAARNFSEYPGVSYPDYNDFASLPEFAGAAAYAASERSFGAGFEVRQINALAITHTFLPLLGAKPALGRVFNVDEDAPDGAAVVAKNNDGGAVRRIFINIEYAAERRLRAQERQKGVRDRQRIDLAHLESRSKAPFRRRICRGAGKFRQTREVVVVRV